MPQPQNIIGIIFDFDNTLSPHPMQEETVLRSLDLNPNDFWTETSSLVAQKFYESELAWMRLLLDNDKFRQWSNSDLQNMGMNLSYFPGLPHFFPQFAESVMNAKYQEYNVAIEYYVITSGIRVILEGSNLKPHMKAIFGSEFDEDANGRLSFPKRAISHTQKTQYLFRINKGYLDLNKDVNDHMPNDERRIPFPNMIYVGDGPTDVPCFAVMSQLGGRTLAVYDPHTESSFNTCMQLHKAHRVEFMAEANYERNTHLWRLLDYTVSEIADRIVEQKRQEQTQEVIPAPRY